jgi:hypothetical protein
MYTPNTIATKSNAVILLSIGAASGGGIQGGGHGGSSA